MEKYEFLSLCRHYNGLTGTTEWFIGIHSSRLSQGLSKMPFVHEENGRLIINNEAEALMALSAIGFELKSTTLYNERNFSTEYFYFQRSC